MNFSGDFSPLAPLPTQVSIMKFKSNAVAAALTMSAATIQPISGFVNPLSTCLWKSRTIHILGNTKSSSLDTPLGGVPSFTDDLTPKTNLGPAPKYLAHKEQMIQTVYDEWRDKYDRGAFDVDRFRIFKLNFIQAQRAHELQTYRAKLLTTGPSSRPPPPLQMNAYADCTPEEYRAIQVMEAKGEMEARKARSPEELVQLKLERQQAVEQAIRDEQERLAREAREKKPKPVPVTIRGPDGEDGDALTSFVGRSDKSKVVEEIKPHATPPAVEDMPRPVPVDMRGPDGQDGDALSSFVGKSPMKKPEMPLPPVQDKPRPVAVDYRGPGEDGAALASFAGRQVGVSIPRSQKPNEKQIDDKIPSPPKIPKEPSPKREEKASPTLEIKPPTDEIPQKDSTHKDVNEGAPKNSIALPSTKKAVKEASSISTDAPKPKKVKPRTDLSSRKAMDTTKNIPLEPAKAPEGTIHVDAKKKQVLGVKSDQEANLPADNVDPSRSNFQSKKESGVPKASPVKPMTRRVVLDPSLTSRVPSAVRPDNRVGELVERRASYFPNRPKTMAAPTASDVPLSASSKKIDDTAIFGAKSATDFPERKKDYDKFVERRAEDPFSTASKGAVTADAEAVLGTKRSATVFPKRTKNHDKATGRQAQPRPSPSSFVVKADIFTQKESATTFPKRQEMLSKLKQMKATQAATQSSTAKPSSSYVQADHHVFQDQSATSFPKRSKGVEKSPQDAATDIKPDASILSTRDATSFPKRVDSYFALVRASQFRDPPNPKAGLTADQKQMNLGAPFSFAKRGQAEDLPPPDEEDMQAASAQRQDDSTIEMSGDAYQVKEITSADDELDEKPRKRISSPFQVISRVSKSKNDDLDSPTTEAVEKSESQKPAVESNVIAPPKPRVEPPSSPMPQGPVSAEQYREAAEARLRNWRESYRALQDEFDEEGEIEEASTTDIGTIPPSVNEMVEESEEVTEEVEESPEEPRNFDGEEEAEGYQEITMRVSEVEVAAPEDDESAEAKLEDDDLEQLQNELEKAEAEADEAAAKGA